MLKKVLLTLMLLAALVSGAGYYLKYDLERFLNTPMAAEGESFDYLLKPGMTVSKIEQEFLDRKLFSRPYYFSYYARYKKLASSIKAGEYPVEPSLTPRQLLDLFIFGRVKQYSLTLIEGWNFKQTLAAVRANPVLEQTLVEVPDAEVMAKLGFAGQHPEGRFYPDTYAFTRGTTDADFLKRAYRKMASMLEKVWQDRQEGLPLKSAYEALTLASIVEKETAATHERPRIAGVFIRRLKKKMKLQTDPTVIYGMGERYDGNIRSRDLKADTPYNTYTREGLTPTPIAMPSGDAITAVLHPDEDGSLYFVAKGDGSGEHEFSKTLVEHNAAVARYLKRLRQARRKQKNQ